MKNLEDYNFCYVLSNIIFNNDIVRRLLSKENFSSLELDVELSLSGCSKITFSELQDLARHSKIKVGDFIIMPYKHCSIPFIAWKVIFYDKEKEAYILQTLDIVEFKPFSKFKSNNYQMSLVRKWLTEDFQNDLLPKDFVSIVNKYYSEEDKSNDVKGDKFWLLSNSEVVNFYKEENKDIVKYALINSDNVNYSCKKYNAGNWWTRESISFATYSSKFNVDNCFFITANGRRYTTYCDTTLGCAPACIL